MKVKGLCGCQWIQTSRSIQGNISMECDHQKGYWMTTLREIAKEECLKICNDCEHKNVEVQLDLMDTAEQ